tara:strand:+ start:4093 stop:6882 length:2790 start_codon:yes stop_codon:yes gene_type:complete
MASTQLSPGVVVLERDLTTVANATLDNVAVIVGSFEKGPVNKIVDITSEKELLSTFGRPSDFNYEYWYSAAQFLLYGGTLKVIRAEASALKNSIDTAQTTQTTFSGADTTLTVKDSTDFSQNDLILIDAEILQVTAVNSNDLTVLRGQLASAATSHAAGSSITLIEQAGTSTTLNEGGTLSSSDTTVTVADSGALNVQLNDYLKIEDEIVRVSAIVGNDLTVTRGELSTTASSHTDGVAVSRLTVTVSKTFINETTVTGVTAPLIKNLEQYESTIETAANAWKWGSRFPGVFGNSIRIVMTDAGPDQILSLAAPTSAEWDFTDIITNKSNVTYNLGNAQAKVFGYTMVVTLSATTINGDFKVDEYWRAETNAASPSSIDVLGQVVAYDPVTRKIELSVDYAQSSDVLEPGDVIALWDAASGGNRTGDKAVVESVERQLRVVNNAGSEDFAANYTIDDDNTSSGGVQVLSVRSEYEERFYGGEQKWINIAPRPTTSPWVKDRGGDNDQMHILILDGDGKLTGTPGSVLEKFLFVSKSTDAKGVQGETLYYKDVIKSNSQFIYWGSHEGSSLMDVDGAANGGFGLSGVSRSFDLIRYAAPIKNNETNLGREIISTTNGSTVKYSLQGGVDGYTVSRANILGGYDLINDRETVDVDYILMGPSMANANDTVAKAQKIIDIAATRKDCIAFISPSRGDVIGQADTNVIVNKTIDMFSKLSSTSYAVFDNNYKYIYDKYNDVYRYIPCNSDVAGLVLNATLNAEAWFSPAGFNRGQLRNAIKLAYSPLKDHRDKLYAARINPVVSFPGQGIVLFGDKTALAYQSAFDRINVRRLFLVLEDAISEAAKTQLFELNDEFTRSSFKNIVEPFLRSIQSRRGIIDFLVVCDTSNNPPEAIDRGEFFAEIFVKPTRSINYITLTFTATRTGSSFAEVTS